MAAVVTSVQQENYSFSEVDGRGQRLIGQFNVSGLTVNATILQDALDEAAIPQYLEAATTDPNMVCVRRNAKMAGKSFQSAVVVTCEFVPAGDVITEGVVRGGTSLIQEQTQVDFAGNALAVSHTWPGGDPDFPGETQTQIGEVPVFRPLTTRTIQKVLATNTPEITSASWTNRVNSTDWGVASPGQWLCLSCFPER